MPVNTKLLTQRYLETHYPEEPQSQHNLRKFGEFCGNLTNRLHSLVSQKPSLPQSAFGEFESRKEHAGCDLNTERKPRQKFTPHKDLPTMGQFTDVLSQSSKDYELYQSAIQMDITRPKPKCSDLLKLSYQKPVVQVRLNELPHSSTDV